MEILKKNHQKKKKKRTNGPVRTKRLSETVSKNRDTANKDERTRGAATLREAS